MRKKRQFLWIVLLSLALLCGCSDATNNNDDTGLVIEETQEPVITEVPTLTSEPTATPAPTATPEPTATPAPTATPEPTPEPYVEDINVYGNTAGNIYNGGLLCEDEDNYYADDIIKEVINPDYMTFYEYIEPKYEEEAKSIDPTIFKMIKAFDEHSSQEDDSH